MSALIVPSGGNSILEIENKQKKNTKNGILL